MIFQLGLTVHGRLTFISMGDYRVRGEGTSKPETGLQSLGQGSWIRAQNGEGQAGSRCRVLKMETKVCGGAGYAVEDFRMSWVMGTHGSEFQCSVTRSVTCNT